MYMYMHMYNEIFVTVPIPAAAYICIWCHSLALTNHAAAGARSDPDLHARVHVHGLPYSA